MTRQEESTRARERERERARRDELLDQAGRLSFPASDPPAVLVDEMPESDPLTVTRRRDRET
jgi:hypothetical protein